MGTRTPAQPPARNVAAKPSKKTETPAKEGASEGGLSGLLLSPPVQMLPKESPPAEVAFSLREKEPPRYAPLVQARAAPSSLRPPIQADGGEPQTSGIAEIAKAGFSGAGSQIPYLSQIQRSFGRHNVSDVIAHSDGAAQKSALKMGASAYAQGKHVAFGIAPDLHTAAHEAAHTVQQQAGVQLAGGVGRTGDPHEQHADAVADRVVQGLSSESLLDLYTGPAQAAATQAQSGTAGTGTQTMASPVNVQFKKLTAQDRTDIIQTVLRVYYENEGPVEDANMVARASIKDDLDQVKEELRMLYVHGDWTKDALVTQAFIAKTFETVEARYNADRAPIIAAQNKKAADERKAQQIAAMNAQSAANQATLAAQRAAQQAAREEQAKKEAAIKAEAQKAARAKAQEAAEAFHKEYLANKAAAEQQAKADKKRDLGLAITYYRNIYLKSRVKAAFAQEDVIWKSAGVAAGIGFFLAEIFTAGAMTPAKIAAQIAERAAFVATRIVREAQSKEMYASIDAMNSLQAGIALGQLVSNKKAVVTTFDGLNGVIKAALASSAKGGFQVKDAFSAKPSAVKSAASVGLEIFEDYAGPEFKLAIQLVAALKGAKGPNIADAAKVAADIALRAVPGGEIGLQSAWLAKASAELAEFEKNRDAVYELLSEAETDLAKLG